MKEEAFQEVALRRFPIKLQQLLKLLRVVATGGEAKTLLEAGRVSVNGQRETRRGRQLFPGDEVAVETEEGLQRYRLREAGP